MEKNEQNGIDTQGVQIPNVEDLEKWLTDDLGRALSLLHAIHNDAAIRRQIAVFFQGRIVNYKNKPDPAQQNIFFPKTHENG